MRPEPVPTGHAPVGSIDAARLRVMRVAGWFLLVGPAAYLALLALTVPDQMVRGLGPALVLILAVATLLLLRTGRVCSASRILVYGLMAGLIPGIMLNGGLNAPQTAALPMLILLAGWLLGVRHAAALTAIGLALVLGLAAYPADLPLPPSQHALSALPLAVVLLISGLLTAYIVRSNDHRVEEVRRLGEALAAEKNQLAQIADNVPVMLFHGDRDKRCLYANRNYAKFYAAERRNLAGLGVREIIGAAAYDQGGVDAMLDRVLAGERLSYRAVRRSAAGEDRVLDVSMIPEPGGKGDIRGFFALFRDVTEEVRGEEALRRSEEKFARVFRSSPLAIAITRLADGRYLDVNDAYLRLFGLPSKEIIGRTSLDIGAWLDPHERQAWVADLRQAGHVHNSESRFRTKDGTLRDALISSELIDLDNEPCALVLVADVTERKRAEEKFAKVFDASPAAIAISRMRDGLFLDVNAAYIEQFGWRREELLGRTSVETGIWPDAAPRNRWAAEMRRLGRTRSYEAVLCIKSGERRAVLISSEQYTMNGEECAIVIVHDITELRRAEEALRASEARLKEAQRIGHVGSWVLELPSLALTWSEEIYRIYERGPEDFDGTFTDLLTMVHPDDLDSVRTIFRDSGRKAGSYEVVHRIVTPAGRIKHIHAQWEVFLDDAGMPQRALGTAQDITAQMLAKEEIQRLNAELENRVRERTAELQSANRELESFAYSISHDLRAPLRGIDGFSHLLAEEYGERLDAKGMDYLKRVRAAAQRMGTLIDDILELSRVSRLSMRRTQVDLSRLAREILDDLLQGSPERRVEVSIAEGCTAFGDPQLLRVMLQNLLENAWKYSRREAAPQIEFGSEPAEGEQAFFVRDNGVGFDMKYADRLFTPFRRLHSPEEFEGTGIGLATVARVVHRHGGRVWAESAPGRGATIRFTLPH